MWYINKRQVQEYADIPRKKYSKYRFTNREIFFKCTVREKTTEKRIMFRCVSFHNHASQVQTPQRLLLRERLLEGLLFMFHIQHYT